MKKISKIQVAANYAQALYAAAEQDNIPDRVRRDCETLAASLVAAPELKALDNPVWKTSRKKELAAQIAGILNLSRPVKEFLELVAENNRFGIINAILKEFFRISNQKQGILEVAVESARELKPEQDKKLKNGLEKLLNQKIIINYKINPEILGGLIIQYNSTRIDDSLLGKLNRLEQVMKGN